MQKAYIFDRSALLIRHWFEVDELDGTCEHGVRLEFRLCEQPERRGTIGAAQRIEIDSPAWRADLFDRIGTEVGSFSAGHYHPRFEGAEPSDRVWDNEIQDDPWAWLVRQLNGMETTLREGGLWLDELATDLVELAGSVPSILGDARSFSTAHCSNNVECYAMTRDLAVIWPAVVDALPSPNHLDTGYVEPWMASR